MDSRSRIQPLPSSRPVSLLTLVLAAVLAALSLTGCLKSDKPLFPTGTWKAATPIKSGYYIQRREFKDADGARFSPDEIPVQIELSGAIYRLTEGGLGDPKTKLGNLFHVGPYGENFDSFVMQSKHEDYWVYQSVYASKTGNFILSNKDCDDMEPVSRALLKQEGYMTKNCTFDDAPKLVTALMGNMIKWGSSRTEYFFLQAETPVSADNLKDRLAITVNPACQGISPNQVPGPAFANAPATAPKGPHLRVISATARDNISVEFALAVEAIGDKAQNYAWLAGWWEWWEDHPAMACAPQKLIKLIAFKPKSNAIDQNKLEPNLERVREACRKDHAGVACGTIDEVIAVHERQGLKILAQGYEMLRYPDNRYTTGSLITVMGTEGLAPRMVWLITYTGASTGAGATRVLYNVAPKT